MTKKGFKVTNASRMKKIGVAAETLNEFMKKSCEKLMVKDDWKTCKCYVANDGTLVDDDEYFGTLPAQTLFVIVQNNETMKTEFEHLYEIIRSTKNEYLTAGESAQIFFSKDTEEKLRSLQSHIQAGEPDNTDLSHAKQHPQWFDGIDTKDLTKEAFMRRKAKDRIKGYFYKAKNLLTNSDAYVNSKNGKAKAEIDSLIVKLRNILDINDYHSYYFDRSSDNCKKLCDDRGEFTCGGLWNATTCHYDAHLINPYRSREERILFQTWNLDHRIELSRSIVPGILNAVQALGSWVDSCYSCNRKVNAGHVSAMWYYKELFTSNNLKLVHIVCHDKAKHETKLDDYVVCESCWNKEVSKNNVKISRR